LRQFDVVENPSPSGRAYAPYLVVLQSHHLDPLDSVILAPVVRDADRPLSLLDVTVEVAGETLVVAMAELASVNRQLLRQAVLSISDHEDDLRRALDRLFTGF
jgi:toxin CcdB